MSIDGVKTTRFQMGGRVSQAVVLEAARPLIPLVAALVAMIIFATAQESNFLTGRNFQNILTQVAVLGVLAASQCILMVAGQLDLSVGSGVALLTVMAAKLLNLDLADGLVVVLVIAGGIVLGTLTGVVVAFTRVQPFIFTLGGLSVLSGLALIFSDAQPIAIGTHYTGLSTSKWIGIPVPGIIFIATCLLGAVLLRWSRLGRQAYAVGSNEDAAYLAGISVRWTKVALYMVNGALVGVAGVLLLARIGSGDATAGAGLELQAITAVVLGGATLSGGRGTELGTFLGVVLLGVISNALNISGVQAAYEPVVFGGVLMFAVVWAALGERSRSGAGSGWRQSWAKTVQRLGVSRPSSRA